MTERSGGMSIGSSDLLDAAEWFDGLAATMEYDAEHNGQRRFQVEAANNAVTYRRWAAAIREASNSDLDRSRLPNTKEKGLI